MTQQKVALITGVTGQDGSYLADFLLSKGYEVHGMVRPSSRELPLNTQESVKVGLKLHYGDLLCLTSLTNLLQKIRPDEIYNLAAQSHVGISFEMPRYTEEINYNGVCNLITAIQTASLTRKSKLYQASTSEMFGNSIYDSLSELDTFAPVSPYGKSKLMAHQQIKNARDVMGMFACAGILFNHESPRRRTEFVTRKVTKGFVDIHYGSPDPVVLGNINAERDWGNAYDYVYAQWLMLQQDRPKDYVIATGIRRSVKDLVNEVAKNLNMKLTWEGTGINTVALFMDRVVARCSAELYRPIDIGSLKGDSSKALEELGWKPMFTFEDTIKQMVIHDKEEHRRNHGRC